MNNKYNFFIAGRARNKENILRICEIFDRYDISYYYKNQNVNDKQQEFEKLDLKSDIVLNIFNQDMMAEKNSDNLLLVLPAGKSGHIEAGVAYGLGKKCYAIGEYDTTDSLYNIFEKIFSNEEELIEFLKRQRNEDE